MKLADHLHACLRYWLGTCCRVGKILRACISPTAKNTAHGVAVKDIRLNSGAFLATQGDRHHLHKEPHPSIDVYSVGGRTNE